MNLFWLDASALIKRYILETGTPLMNHLFARVPPSQIVCLLEGIGETLSILHRRRSARLISRRVSQQAIAALRLEIIDELEIEKIERTVGQVVNSWMALDQHTLNSTDAIILRCALDYAAQLRKVGHDLVMVSADARLLRAAKTEGLQIINPESDDLPAIDVLL
jgi:uncharacterized protein